MVSLPIRGTLSLVFRPPSPSRSLPSRRSSERERAWCWPSSWRPWSHDHAIGLRHPRQMRTTARGEPPPKNKNGGEGPAICYQSPPPPEDENDGKGKPSAMVLCHLQKTRTAAKGQRSAINLRHRRKMRMTAASHLLWSSATSKRQERRRGASDLLSISATAEDENDGKGKPSAIVLRHLQKTNDGEGPAIGYQSPPPPEDQNDSKGKPSAIVLHHLQKTRTAARGRRSAINLHHHRKTRTTVRASHLLSTSATARGQELRQEASNLLSTSTNARRRERRQEFLMLQDFIHMFVTCDLLGLVYTLGKYAAVSRDLPKYGVWGAAEYEVCDMPYTFKNLTDFEVCGSRNFLVAEDISFGRQFRVYLPSTRYFFVTVIHILIASKQETSCCRMNRGNSEMAKRDKFSAKGVFYMLFPHSLIFSLSSE
uniref:Uncharacterized protein LOC105045135 isoform X2 n=1 Tax=Elaeis guineensis var. tenera TaxID=51953 RepID=A0A8N4IAJ3_ELAGV|nr:uncharacterized protein LOC105045135 isoform X2 [Elaeis guineensis]